MIIDNSVPEQSGPDPVRLVGAGAEGISFVKALLDCANGPLADLMGQCHEVLLSAGDASAVDALNVQGVAFIFLAFSLTATEDEIDVALQLAWHAWTADVYVIGVVLSTDPSLVVPSRILDFLVSGIDGRIDIRVPTEGQDLMSLRWMYGALRSVVREGFLILEPAWDLYDVVEVLDLPGAQLTLSTSWVDDSLSVLDAVCLAFDELARNGVDLEQASGALVILWQAPGTSSPAGYARGTGLVVSRVLGRGSLHMTLAARSRVPWEGTSACATVVVSSPRRAQPATKEAP